MSGVKEKSKRLASLAVFRELYNSKKDVYGIISEFLNEIIASKGMHQFNVTEITNLLNTTFDFSIPEAVVNTSLRRLDYLKKEHGRYIVDPLPKTSVQNISSLQEKIIASNNIIISDLFSFVESRQKNKLSESEKEIIVHSFCSFLLDDSNGKGYSEYISAFVIKNKHNDVFRKQLNKIREGIILYSGLTYNNNLSEVGAWANELTIYLDTEVLFHFSGYNGELFKSLFYDFFQYVKEINHKASKLLISLKYFSEVDKEIKGFFHKAKLIIEGKGQQNPKATAMSSILSGCKDPSDVMDKQADFYLHLKNNNIKMDETCDYSKEDNYGYNIVDKSTIEDISNEFEFDITEHLCFLNYIHVNRKEENLNNFYNIGCILLTGNFRTIKVAWHKLIKMEGEVPLATTLAWLTNKFWYKLNKGFSAGALPKNFDIITKAHIILSSSLNQSVGEKYDDLQKQYSDGDLSSEQVKARILNLRKQVVKPEDIADEDVSSILDVISEDSLEKFIVEQEHFRIRAERHSEENTKLKNNINSKKKEIDEYARSQTVLEAQNIELNKMRLQEKQKTIALLENQKKPLDIEVDLTLRLFKLKIIGAIVLLYALSYYLIWKFGWNNLEQWIWVVSAIFPMASVIFMFAKEKTINPLEILRNKRLAVQDKKYCKYNFDCSLLEMLKKEKDDLIAEIDS